jgi:hypothetical protein
VGYWRLGETSGTSAADAAGTHTATYTGGYTLGQPSLVTTDTNPSVALNGTGSVGVPDATDLKFAGPFSLEAWIRPTSLPAAGAFASVLTKAESYSLQFNGPQLEYTIIQNGVRQRLKAPAGSIAAGSTYHVVGSYDGTTQRLYLNGKMVSSAALSGAATSTTNPLTIGSWNGSGEYFSGRVDDVAVYGKALSAVQVSNHYTAGAGGPAPTTQTVSVTTTGTGTGTVTSSPSGISCPPTCSAQMPSGGTVTLTATPASGSTFGGWTAGACSGTSPTCTFNAYAATSATASFTSSTTPPPASTGYSAAVTGDGPVSYWRLGETSGTSAADAVGGRPGTYTNGPTLNQPSLLTSDTNPSVALDGTNDDIRVPNAAALQFGSAFSLEAWIRPTVVPAAGAFASVLTKAESYSLQFNGPQLEFTLIQNGVRKRLKAAAGAIVAGKTYHVVATYDGATQRLYINGAQAASVALTGPATSNTNSLVIGSWQGGELFAGRVDEVAVYGKTLTAARVQAHYGAGTAAAGG